MLYTKYVYFFQGAGLILLVAMIGAIVLTLRHKEGVKRQSIAAQVARGPTTAIEVVKVESGRGDHAGGSGASVMTIGLGHYLTVAAILFTLGIFGIFLNRKNVIVILMSIELMLLAVNINLVAFSSLPGRPRRPGLRAVRADGRRRRGGHRACHRRRLLPQPRLDRGRRHQHDEGLSGDGIVSGQSRAMSGRHVIAGSFGHGCASGRDRRMIYTAIVFLPLVGALIAGLLGRVHRRRGRARSSPRRSWCSRGAVVGRLLAGRLRRRRPRKVAAAALGRRRASSTSTGRSASTR